jgi:hypothetical protein
MSNYLTPIFKTNNVILVFTVITIAVLIDTSLIKMSDLYPELAVSSSSTVIFIGIVSVSIIGQYFILTFVKLKGKEITGKSETFYLNMIHNVVSASQYVLLICLTIVIFQILVTEHYSVIILTVATTISYSLAVAIMGLLAVRFFSWFRSNRDLVVLFYAITSVTLVINSGLTLAFALDILSDRPTEVWARMGSGLFTTNQNEVTAMLNFAYILSSVISFVSTWAATAFLLRHYSRTIGDFRYWATVSIPLVYFLSQFISLFLNLFTPYLESDPVFYGQVLTLIFTLSKAAGGIFFGLAFLFLTRNINVNVVKVYLCIAAFGFVLYFISNQGIAVSNAFYPPFGLVTVTFSGLSSYLILAGIYSSAISISQDAKLRQSIRKFALRQSELLDSIGTSHMEQEIQKRVVVMSKQMQETMQEQSGIQTSLNDQDIKKYLQEVLQELKKTENTQNTP